MRAGSVSRDHDRRARHRRAAPADGRARGEADAPHGAAPLLRLSGAVQDAGLKVVTTGEGADELFGGYDLFRENAVRHFWAREPESSCARFSSRG